MKMTSFVRLTYCEDWEDPDLAAADRPIAIDVGRIVAFTAGDGGTWLHICTHDEWELPAQDSRGREQGQSLMVRETFEEVWKLVQAALAGADRGAVKP